MTGALDTSACSKANALGIGKERRGSVNGSALGLTPGRPPESSQRDEQQGAPPFSGRAISLLSACMAATRREGGAFRSYAVARSAFSRQIGHEHTWCPPTIIPWHWQRCSAALARGARPAAPERASINAAAATRLSRRAGRPLSTWLG